MKVNKHQAEISKLISNTAKATIQNNLLVRFCIGSDSSQGFYPAITMSSRNCVAVVIPSREFNADAVNTTFACTTKYRFKSVINNSFNLARLAHCDSRFSPNFVCQELSWVTKVADEMLGGKDGVLVEEYATVEQQTYQDKVKSILVRLNTLK